MLSEQELSIDFFTALYGMSYFAIWENLGGGFLFPLDLDLMARTKCL
jgi:hypothetical protein